MGFSAVVTRGFLFSTALIVSVGYATSSEIVVTAVHGHGGQKKDKSEPYPFQRDWSVEVRPNAPPREVEHEPAPVSVEEPVPIEDVFAGIDFAERQRFAGSLADLRTLEDEIQRKLRKRQRDREDEEMLFRLGAFD